MTVKYSHSLTFGWYGANVKSFFTRPQLWVFIGALRLFFSRSAPGSYSKKCWSRADSLESRRRKTKYKQQASAIWRLLCMNKQLLFGFRKKKKVIWISVTVLHLISCSFPQCLSPKPAELYRSHWCPASSQQLNEEWGSGYEPFVQSWKLRWRVGQRREHLTSAQLMWHHTGVWGEGVSYQTHRPASKHFWWHIAYVALASVYPLVNELLSKNDSSLRALRMQISDISRNTALWKWLHEKISWL